VSARDDERRRRARTRSVTGSIGLDIRRLREDAALTQAAVARAVGISPGHLCGIEKGTSEASTAVLVGIADVLGADLSIRAYPNTGPRIHDRIQSLIVEHLLRAVRPRWRAFVEVPVTRPARGYVDVVLADSGQPLYVATEVSSEIRRLEQHFRWAQDKAASLTSAALWASAPIGSEVSRLLVLRSTRTTRDLAQRFPDTFQALYPARARDVFDSVCAGRPWPGPGILWARVEGDVVTLLDRPPRGVAFGR
jgi:transcriptional regulator with XRE-family HTH domain